MKSLDLHGCTVEDVDDRVDRFLTNNSKENRVRIVTGKGTGKVKAAVIRYLKLGRYPWIHEKLGNGKDNEGVLVVILE